MSKEYKDLVVGLDIGTAKVMVVVAEVLGSSTHQRSLERLKAQLPEEGASSMWGTVTFPAVGDEAGSGESGPTQRP